MLISANRVLLVDDNDELRDATRELLEEAGCQVWTAASGDQALDLVATGKTVFDLLITDVFMPGPSGIELADRLLRRDDRLPVLLISSRGGDPQLRQRLAKGDLAFLAKPFSPDELAAKVAEARDLATGRGATGPRLERSLVHPPPPPAEPQSAASRQLQASGRRKKRSRAPRVPAYLQAAAIAVLVLGGTVLRNQDFGAPSLPAPGPDPILRGAAIEAFRPIGTVSSAPAALAWRPIPDANTYSVALRSVDGTALWQAEVSGPAADLTAEVTARLQSAVTYYWSVEAVDDRGRLLASSGPIRFVVELTPDPSSETP